MDPHPTDCGCCAGADAETPVLIENAPGQPSIAYRAGKYALFKESLLARLSSSDHPGLAALSTRDDDDFTIALCDALAAALDVLTFYQERIANEHYLRTAIENRSIMAMARLIGYVPAPGVSASTCLAFTLLETPGDTTQSAEPLTIPGGTRVQSVPASGETAQVFETSADAEARTEWNEVAVQRSGPWQPAFGDTDLYLEGVATQLLPGDAILIVGKERENDAGNEQWDVRVLASVEADTTNGRTRVSWADPLGHTYPEIHPAAEGVQVFAFRQRAALFGHNAPDPTLLASSNAGLSSLIIDDPDDATGLKVWMSFDIPTSYIDLDAAYPKITADSWIALVSNESGLGTPSLPGYVELYRAARVSQMSRSQFGLSGRVTRITPDTTENLTSSRFDLRETLVLAQSEALATVSRPLLYPLYGDTVALDQLVDGLIPGQAIAISGKRQRLMVAAGVNSLTLTMDDGGTVSLAEGDSLVLVEAPAEVSGSTTAYLDSETFGSFLGQDVDLRLVVLDRDGNGGSLTCLASEILLEASHEDDPEVSEVAFVASDSEAVKSDRDRTTLALADSLANCYERATTKINANVAPATQGESVEEILGSGDASLPDQAFTLLQKPLTYVSADTPSGRASALEVRVNDLLWSEVLSLYGSGPNDRAYTVSTDEEGAATVRFGDGIEGARLPTGQNNVRAAYRKGLGVGGNVAAARITTLLDRPLGVTGATNPGVASGGEDSESLDMARENAPLTVLTLDRAVSIQDYRDFARAFAGIAKAHALWIPAGSARGVFLTVAGIDGAAIGTESATYSNLLDALTTYGDPLMPIHIADYRPAYFRTSLTVKVAEDYEADAVLDSVESALRAGFSFDQRSFGQGVSRDEVMAVAHTVPGVEAVHVTQFYRAESGASVTFPSRLTAELPVAVLTGLPLAAELLTLDDDPVDITEMP